MFTKLTKSIRKFHSDEEGLEALQVVMIIAIAAMIMIACATLGKKAVDLDEETMDGHGKGRQGHQVSPTTPPKNPSQVTQHRGHLAFFVESVDTARIFSQPVTPAKSTVRDFVAGTKFETCQTFK